MKPSFLDKFEFVTVRFYIRILNSILNIFCKFLFSPPGDSPKNIIVYKIGNIGDIVCAVPAFIAIRRAYPEAKITLLTSPGKKGALGAKELLIGVWYFNEIKVYYTEDINSWSKTINFVRGLRKNRYDLFIQLDDLGNFKRFLRNPIFAKAIGAKSSLGFKVRTVQLFKKTQVDYTTQKTEVESLLDLLKENGIPVKKIEFDFNISEEQKTKVKRLIDNIRTSDVPILIVAINPGGKRGANRWPAERFAEVVEYLQNKYNAKIIIVGGPNDVELAEVIKKKLKPANVLDCCGKMEVLETLESLKYCSFLLSNDTGTIHMAAAIGLPVIGLYTIRNIFGRWFPYGKGHKILYHRFLECNYKKEECIKKSIEMITVEKVKNICDEFINKKNIICRRP